jgi:thiol:disulfide interchange protein
MLPVVRELEAEYAERAGVLVLDYYAADTRPLLSEYGVRGHPSFLVLGRDGSPSRVLQGVVPKETFVELLDAALA